MVAIGWSLSGEAASQIVSLMPLTKVIVCVAASAAGAALVGDAVGDGLCDGCCDGLRWGVVAGLGESEDDALGAEGD